MVVWGEDQGISPQFWGLAVLSLWGRYRVCPHGSGIWGAAAIPLFVKPSPRGDRAPFASSPFRGTFHLPFRSPAPCNLQIKRPLSPQRLRLTIGLGRSSPHPP